MTLELHPGPAFAARLRRPSVRRGTAPAPPTRREFFELERKTLSPSAPVCASASASRHPGVPATPCLDRGRAAAVPVPNAPARAGVPQRLPSRPR